MTPTAIAWPSIQIGGERWTLRLSYTAHYQLAVWGKSIATATSIELAAAMMGRFDERGKWRSAAFRNPVELADILSDLDDATRDAQQGALLEAVVDAIKKAYPDLAITAAPAPGTPTPPQTTN